MSNVGRVLMIGVLVGAAGCASARDEAIDAGDAPLLGRLGDRCESAADCAGIPCVDGVCCNTVCAGVCEACNVPGAAGTCTAIPDGADPAEECGPVGCGEYFRGWDRGICYGSVDVSARDAVCNGARACRAPEVACAGAVPGEAAMSCDSECQTPELGTCTAMTPGACVNIDRGVQTCGLGVCAVTVPRCRDGAAVECVPNSGASSPEVCNGMDDDCDGLIDDDRAEPNDSCAQFHGLEPVLSGQVRDREDLTLAVAGDEDFFRIPAQEGDTACADCDGTGTVDRYNMYLYLRTPRDAGSYMFCSGLSCADVNTRCVEVPAGKSGTLSWTFSGSCATTDSFEVFVRVLGHQAPGMSCAPYLFSYEIVKTCEPPG